MNSAAQRRHRRLARQIEDEWLSEASVSEQPFSVEPQPKAVADEGYRQWVAWQNRERLALIHRPISVI